RVVTLPAHREVIADPEVALAVEHRLAARTVPAAIELEWQHPRAGRPVEVWHVRHRSQVLALWDRIELVEQRVEPPGLVPRILRDRLGRGQRVGRRATLWRCGRREELAACITRHARHATGEHA